MKTYFQIYISYKTEQTNKAFCNMSALETSVTVILDLTLDYPLLVTHNFSVRDTLYQKGMTEGQILHHE